MSVIFINDTLNKKSNELREKICIAPEHKKDVLQSNKRFIKCYNQFTTNRLTVLKQLAKNYYTNRTIFNQAMDELKVLNPTPENLVGLLDKFFTDNVESIYNKIKTTATEEELIFFNIK